MTLVDLKFCSDQVRDAWIQNQEERDKLEYLFGSWKGGKEYEQAVLYGLQFCSGLLYRRIASEARVFEHLTIPKGTQVRSRLSDTEIAKVIKSLLIIGCLLKQCLRLSKQIQNGQLY